MSKLRVIFANFEFSQLVGFTTYALFSYYNILGLSSHSELAWKILISSNKAASRTLSSVFCIKTKHTSQLVTARSKELYYVGIKVYL